MTLESRELDDLKNLLNETILKVELSRKDIRDIQKFHDRIESFIDDFQTSIARINKILEIQEYVASNTEQNFQQKSEELRQLVDDLQKEYRISFDKIKKEVTKELEKSTEPYKDFDERLRTVEKFQWKWAGIVLGAAIVISFLISKIPNPLALLGGLGG